MKFCSRISGRKDFLHFTDLKSYQKRLEETWAKTEITDSIRVAAGEIKEHRIVIGCMDFEFIGGSLGSVMGERISRAVDYCLEHRVPLHDHLQIRRSADDGKRIFADADGQSVGKVVPAHRCQNTVISPS